MTRIGIFALFVHFDRSKPRRTPQSCLFISLNQEYQQDISAGSVSKWVSQTVSQAYRVVTPETLVLHLHAHEIRALVASAAFRQSVSLSSTLEAAFWRSESTLFQYFLRDLASHKGDGSFWLFFIPVQSVMRFWQLFHLDWIFPIFLVFVSKSL